MKKIVFAILLSAGMSIPFLSFTESGESGDAEGCYKVMELACGVGSRSVCQFTGVWGTKLDCYKTDCFGFKQVEYYCTKSGTTIYSHEK